MPTYKNGGNKTVVYEGTIQKPNGREKEVMVFFDAGSVVPLDFWIPYEKLGLELIDAENPPVQGSILVSGTFNFNEGTERIFPLEHCDKFSLDVIIQSGSIKLYRGSEPIGTVIDAGTERPYRYHVVEDWNYAPYIRAVGLEDNTVAVIHAEILRLGLRGDS